MLRNKCYILTIDPFGIWLLVFFFCKCPGSPLFIFVCFLGDVFKSWRPKIIKNLNIACKQIRIYLQRIKSIHAHVHTTHNTKPTQSSSRGPKFICLAHRHRYSEVQPEDSRFHWDPTVHSLLTRAGLIPPSILLQGTEAEALQPLPACRDGKSGEGLSFPCERSDLMGLSQPFAPI